MKIKKCRVNVIVFLFSITLVMGIAACSFDTSGKADAEDASGPVASAEVPRETAAPQPETPSAPETETQKPETSQPEAEKMEAPETTVPADDGNEYSDPEEISVGDPIVGIVDKFGDNVIVIKDAGDPDLVYYFSTQNAQVVEGDSPIAAGDMVAITYRGVMGDEEHPGEAVKVVAESMMYQ